jgi:UDP-N-acetyl-2-amino-2-deoxyglucuronate dehydrogenase
LRDCLWKRLPSTITLFYKRRKSMSRQKIRVGLVGVGGAAYMHEIGYKSSSEFAEIVAMCDVNEKGVAKRAKNLNARVYTDYHELVSDPAIDLVDICTPHFLHYEVALAALEQKKHVFVEKPITVRSEQAMELINKAKEAGVKLSVAENTRFVKSYLETEKILKEGLLGDIRTVRTLIGGSEVPRIKFGNSWVGKKPYGGAILDMCVHTFYLFKWLFGGLHDVRGFSSKIIPEGEMEDNAVVLGHLANGAEIITNVSCTMEIPWTERLEIYGSKGGLIVDHLASPTLKYFKGGMNFEGVGVEAVPYDPRGWKYLSFVEEVKDFVNAVYEDRLPTIDPMDGYYAVKGVEAVEESIASGRQVVV